MKKISLLIGAVSIFFLAGCSTSSVPAIPTTTPTADTTTAPAAKIAVKDITISNFQFAPADIEIAVGETVQWINNDTAPHTIVSDDGSFQSPTLAQGESFNFTFAQAGTYAYHCSIHPSMQGTVTVK